MRCFSISKTVKTYPKLPYETIKNDILGTTYDVSLVFIGLRRAQTLNQTTRGKSYTPNVLSFPLSTKAGEIYITPRKAATEAKQYGHTPREHVGYLFIHGLLHLKGLDHGTKMDTLEKKYLKKHILK
jgi:probable rRNA maturation factor